jgi:hypothetical protein
LITAGCALVLALLLGAGQASAVVPENCIGVRCQWEQEIERREKNLHNSRMTEIDAWRSMRGNFGVGRGRLPDPGLGSLMVDHPSSLPYQIDTWRNPPPGQRNSRLTNERQVSEINRFRRYIRRCFAADDPVECQVVWVNETVTQNDITYTFDLFNCYGPAALWTGTVTVHEIGDYRVNFVPNSSTPIVFGIEPQIADEELPIEFGLEWEYLVTCDVGADFPALDFKGGYTAMWGFSSFVDTPFRFQVQFGNPPKSVAAQCP